MIHIEIKKELLGSLGPMTLDVELEIEKGSFTALYGESGSGKTTLLRIIAGLESAEGKVSAFSDIWQDEKSRLSIQKRNIGFVFQDYALFDNMSVYQNLLFVKKDRHLAEKLLGLTHLLELKDRFPQTLSGGQKQRVALCRAFMNEPKLLLMDEPLSALDPTMRTKLQEDILNLHKTFDVTTIMVSHDPSEIYRLADQVVVLNQGKISEKTTAKELFLKTKGSKKFTLMGEILELIQADVIYIAVVSIGQQIVEVVIDESEANSFDIGEKVEVSTKAFAPSLSKISSS